jgi:hypothetical protein
LKNENVSLKTQHHKDSELVTKYQVPNSELFVEVEQQRKVLLENLHKLVESNASMDNTLQPLTCKQVTKSSCQLLMA